MNTNNSNSRFSQGLGSVRDPKMRYVILPVFFIFIGFLLTRFVGFGKVGQTCDNSDPPECGMTTVGLISVLTGILSILVSMWFMWTNRHRWSPN
jgi:hypothetical protein